MGVPGGWESPAAARRRARRGRCRLGARRAPGGRAQLRTLACVGVRRVAVWTPDEAAAPDRLRPYGVVSRRRSDRVGPVEGKRISDRGRAAGRARAARPHAARAPRAGERAALVAWRPATGLHGGEDAAGGLALEPPPRVRGDLAHALLQRLEAVRLALLLLL